MKITFVQSLVVLAMFVCVAPVGGQRSDNPFRNESSDPFGQLPKDLPKRTPDQQAEIERQDKLKLEMLLETLSSENEHLRERVNLLRPQFEAISNAHNRLIVKLLSSGDASFQMAGLEHILECCHQNVPLVPDQMVNAKLKRLVDSDSAGLRQSAVAAWIQYDKDAARESGFQSGSWLPLTESRTARAIESQLSSIVDYIVYDEVKFSECVLDFKSRYKFQITIEPGVDTERLISIEADHIGLHAALEKMLADQNWTYRIDENELVILPLDSPKAVSSETYNVRGLLSKSLDIQAIADVARKAISDKAGKGAVSVVAV